MFVGSAVARNATAAVTLFVDAAVRGSDQDGDGSRLHWTSRKQFIESTNPTDSKASEASTSLSINNLGSVDSASLPSTSKAAEVVEYPRNPSATTSTLVELTTRLDFFKERRSQLMEQLQNLDLNSGPTPPDFVYKLSSPPWN